MAKSINGKNYYNEESFNQMVEALEAGEVISIYIDCIGHTRAEIEEWHYKTALQNKYGDRLIRGMDKYGSATYKLEGVKKTRKPRRKKGE